MISLAVSLSNLKKNMDGERNPNWNKKGIYYLFGNKKNKY